jgi:hypothetical protein
MLNNISIHEDIESKSVYVTLLVKLNQIDIIKCRIIDNKYLDENECWVEILEDEYCYTTGENLIINRNNILNIK